MKRAMLSVCIAALLLAAVDTGLAQWQRLGLDSVFAFHQIGSTVFAGTRASGVFRSTDGGTTWARSSAGLTAGHVKAFVSTATSVIAGCNDGGVFRSTSNGQSWTPVTSGIGTPAVHAMAVSGSNVYAATNANGVFLSTNDGVSWTNVNTGLTGLSFHGVTAPGSRVFVGGDLGVFVSTNSGASWAESNTGLTGALVRSLASAGSNIFAGTNNSGVFVSTNNGVTWTNPNLGLPSTFTRSVAARPGLLLAGTTAGVGRSTNEGASWNSVNDGLTDLSTVCVFFGTDYAFVGTQLASFRRRLDQLNAVREVPSLAPLVFGLEQNFPNPFNPSTRFEFRVPSSELVTLKVFDLLGREVATLVNEPLKAGSYETGFQGGNLPTGMYVYQLRSGASIASRRMLLVK